MKKKLKRIGIVALLLLLMAAAVFLRHRFDETEAAEHPSLETVRQFLPDAASIDFLQDEEIFGVRDKEGGLSGFVVTSSPHMDSITGYSGPTPVMIALDADGRIAGIELLQNTETPGFIRQLEDDSFFKRWDGLSVEEAAVREVDAVSGATMSSVAIANTVRGRMTMLADGIDEAWFTSYGRIVFSFQDGVILFVLLGTVLMHLQSSLLAARGWMPRLRYIWLGVSLLLLGIYSATMFSMALLDGWVNSGRLHGGVGMIIMAFMAVGWTLFTGKNIYCANICPFGALQELSFRLSPINHRIPVALKKRLCYVRYVLLFLTSGYIILRIGLPPDLQEPFSAFRPRAAGLPALSLAVLSLLVAVAGVNRPWCNYCCSSGALLDLLRKAGKGS